MSFKKSIGKLLFLVVCMLMISCTVNAGIIVPSIVSETNTNQYSTASTATLTDNSGMTPAVSAGISLGESLSAIHANTGVFESWVTNASAPDYFVGFGGDNPPEITWDLTGGGDTPVATLIIWQYQNDGGGNNQVGNHARTIELQFNTDAQGSDTFDGPVSTVMALPVLTGDDNAAQPLSLPGGEYRYVFMRLTDNHAGDPDGVGVHATTGGDRVGLGEVRFSEEVYLSPENASKALNPLVTQVESSEPAYVDITLGWDTGMIYNPDDANEIIVDPSILTHAIYMSDGSLTDPNLYFVDEIDASGSGASYGPVVLSRSRTYYWRVDELTDANAIRGDVWAFVTMASDPTIASGPADQYINAGESATFSVDAVNPFTDDSSGLSFEWHLVNDGGDAIVGDDSASYTTGEQSAENTGDGYYCVVSIVEPDVDATVISDSAYVVIKQRIAYWPFDGTYENIDDASGSTDGVLVGEPGFDEGIVNAGQALSLDGVDDYLTVNNDALDWSPTGSFSVSVWANVGGGGYRALISNRQEPPVQGFILYAQSNNQWGFWTGGGNWSGPGGVPVTNGSWTHIAITFEPTGKSGDNFIGTSILYVNGVQARVMEGDVYLPKAAETSDLFIGAGQNENPANFFFNGLIDDVRIFNYAISHEDIAVAYTDIAGPSCIYGNPQFDFSGPDGTPDCAVDFYDFVKFAAQWLDHGFFPYRP